MKIFVIKSLFIFVCIFILFQITVGSIVKKYQEKLDYLVSKEQLIHIKDKLRKEMRAAINKDVYLDPEDSKLISQFIKKIEKEINLQK